MSRLVGRVTSASGSDVEGAGVDLLDSWKEISVYFNRDVRTVRRWETTRGLPVHRLPGGARRAVYARKSELEAWRLRRDADETPRTSPVRSIAVLPFVNLTADKDNEYFGDGLADEIITRLAGVPGLRVTARTSSFAFRNRNQDVRRLGARLGVSTLLEGTVNRSGDRIRVTVQLIGARDGYHRWAKHFDGHADDVFRVQEEIAQGVVDCLAAGRPAASQWGPGRGHRPTREAFDLNLKGRYLLNRRGPGHMQRAVECFERVVALDPAYAAPHLGLAEAFSALGLWGLVPPRAAYARVREEAERALTLDDSLGPARVALATALLFGDWNWDLARVHFRRADTQAIAPSGPVGIGFYYLLDGRPAAAFRYLRTALERDPLSAVLRTQAAATYIALRDLTTATALLEEALELDERLPTATFWLGFCRGVQRRVEDAVRLLEAAAADGLAASLAYLVCVLARARSAERAAAVHERLARAAAASYVSPFHLALSHAALGHKARSVELLAAAEAERAPTYTLSLVGPGFLDLSPSWLQRRFDSRARQLGLPRMPR